MSNPTGWLGLLEQLGSKVTPLGSSTVGGTPREGVRHHPRHGKDRRSPQLSLCPRWARSLLSKLTVGNAGVKVYVDSSGLVRQLTVAVSGSVGSSKPFTFDAKATFSAYGAPVNIAAPPPGQVVTAKQLLKGSGSPPAGPPHGGPPPAI